MEKVKERTSKYGISVRNTSNGYFEARTTFRLGGGHSNRLQKGGKTQELAILNLLTALDNFIDNSFKNRTIISKIDDAVSQQLVKSINDLGIAMPEIMQKALEIVNRINGINARISNNLYIQSNVLPFYNQQNTNSNISIPQSNTASNIENGQVITDKYIIEDVAIQWKKYELQLCVKSDDNPRPLCQKTVDGYISILNNTILPFLKKVKILYITQIDEDIIKELLKSVNGYQGKRIAYIVLSLMFQYLIKQKIISENPLKQVDKPVKPAKSEEDEIVVIEVENQQKYLDMFAKENTDMSLLFETMLLTRY